jgi:transcription antitermination factor NusG
VNDPQYRWYIWYTRPRAEKKIHERLLNKGIEVFLPLRRERRQWSDRKKWVDAPLFNGYIFTCISEREWEKVTYTEGILTYVRMEGKPAALRHDQVEDIKELCGLSDSVEIVDGADIPVLGEEVIIKGGPFKGLTANAVQYRGLQKIAVHIEQLGKTVLLELPVRFVQRMNKAA